MASADGRTHPGPYFLGKTDAPVTLDEYADFQWPGCGQFTRVVAPEIVSRYVETGKVKLVWHDFAWIGSESRQAAQAARCAGRQGKFWEYHDHLFNNQRGENRGQFSDDNLKQFAGNVGLDAPAFGACLERAEDLVSIQHDLATARAEGITATPSFKVNGQRLVGARSVDAFAQAIDAELAKLGR